MTWGPKGCRAWWGITLWAQYLRRIPPPPPPCLGTALRKNRPLVARSNCHATFFYRRIGFFMVVVDAGQVFRCAAGGGNYVVHILPHFSTPCPTSGSLADADNGLLCSVFFLSCPLGQFKLWPPVSHACLLLREWSLSKSRGGASEKHGRRLFSLCPAPDAAPPQHPPPCRWVPWWQRRFTPLQPSQAELRCHQGITEYASVATCRGCFRVPVASAPPLPGRADNFTLFFHLTQFTPMPQSTVLLSHRRSHVHYR